MKALIFNSGLGTRMGEFTKTSHKAMTPLQNGETILHRQLRLLTEEGVREIIITVGPFEEQIRATARQFPKTKFYFIRNKIYHKTNYIYSLFIARDYIDDNMLFLHGDLVFTQQLVHDILQCKDKDCATVHFTKPLPQKDFKGRVHDGKILEVSINIFDNDCYAFQPFYKLQKDTATAWLTNVRQFISAGKCTCYAEDALNEIATTLNIRAFSYAGYYIDEIDTVEDRLRVMEELDHVENHTTTGYAKRLAYPPAKNPLLSA